MLFTAQDNLVLLPKLNASGTSFSSNHVYTQKSILKIIILTFSCRYYRGM